MHPHAVKISRKNRNLCRQVIIDPQRIAAMIMIRDCEGIETDVESTEEGGETVVFEATEPMDVLPRKKTSDTLRDFPFLKKIADEDELSLRIYGGGRLQKVPVITTVDLADAADDGTTKLMNRVELTRYRCFLGGNEVLGNPVVQKFERELRVAFRIVANELRRHGEAGITKRNKKFLVVIHVTRRKTIVGECVVSPIGDKGSGQSLPYYRCDR